MGSTFQIAPAGSDTLPLAQSSTPVITTGTIMGCVILVLIGIIVHQFISFRMRQLKRSATNEIKLEAIPDTSVQTPSTYEDLKIVEQVTGSTYDALERSETKATQTSRPEARYGLPPPPGGIL